MVAHAEHPAGVERQVIHPERPMTAPHTWDSVGVVRGVEGSAKGRNDDLLCMRSCDP